LKQNYSYYKGKLNNFYNKEEEDKNPTKEDILQKLNASTKVDEFELVIKNVIDDLSESKILEGTLDQKLVAIKTALKEMGTMLKTQVGLVPRIEYTVESNLNDVLKDFKETTTDYITEKFSINNAMFEFSLGNVALLDSKILKGTDQGLMLKKWISNGSVRFKLIWRGSRDGFTSQAFHAKCDKYKPTLLLCSATTGKVFGGFTD